MSYFYAIGDCVVYGTNGVCLIEDIRKLDYAGKNDFYILKPIGNKNSTFCVPADCEDADPRLRRTLSKDEIDTVIKSVKDENELWIDDRKKRSESFRQILKSNNQQELLRLAGCIYQKREELTADGKRLSSADEIALQSAQNAVNGEFAFVLGIDEDSVGEYIRKVMGI